MVVKEALVALATLSELMSEIFEEIILHVRGWVNNRIEIAVVRSYSCMICGASLPSALWDQDLEWYLG